MGYFLSIPTDPEELANVLELHSTDWENSLYFLYSFADGCGTKLPYKETYDLMKQRIEDKTDE